MKNIKKLLAIVAVLAMVLTGVIALVACDEPHECAHKCATCGKCLDKDCTDEVCKDKCAGHTPAAHVCAHKCTVEGCGKCTDKNCKDAACSDKCPGHDAPAPHVCGHVCEVEGCGKCKDPNCNDSVCASKCPGHDTPAPHVCASKCPTCEKCLTNCNDPACSDKCTGHEPELISAWYVETSLVDKEDDSDNYLISVTLKDAIATAANAASATVSFPADADHAYIVVKYSGTATLAGVGLWGTKDGENSANNGYSCGGPTGWNKQDNSYFGEDFSVLVLKVDGYYAAGEWDIDTVTNIGFSLTGSADATFTVYAIEVRADANSDLIPHICKHVCLDENCDKCTDLTCDDPACAEKCEGHTYTITLDAGDGALEADAATTLTAVKNVISGADLPEATATAAHWHFIGWFDAATGGNAIDIDSEEIVFHKDTTLYARYARDNGVWSGDTFIAALMINSGSTTRVEYWLGGSKMTLAKDDVISLYIDGKLIRHYVEPNSAGIVKPAASAQVTEVTVSVAGEMAIYLHKNASDWSCEYSGPTEVITSSDVPAGCDMFTVTIGTNKINFFLKDSSGNSVSKKDFSKFCIYTYQDEIFGDWNGAPTKGVLQEEMTGSATAVPNGWIFRWGSGYGQQTSNIIGAFKAGKTYLVELKGHQQAATVTELTISSVYTVTLDQNYEGQPEDMETTRAYNGKLTNLPEITREDYTFDGWFTLAEGGDEVTLDSDITADITVYAHWTAVETPETPETPVE